MSVSDLARSGATGPATTGRADGSRTEDFDPTLSRKPRGTWSLTAPLTLVLWALVLLYAFPLVWFLLSSFKPGSELFTYPLSIWPRDWTTASYGEAWSRFNFSRYFLNTGLVAVVTTVLTVFVSAITGYAFAKYESRWLRAFF